MWRSVARRAPRVISYLTSPHEPILSSQARTLVPTNNKLTQLHDSCFRERTQVTHFSPNSFQIRALGSVAEAEAASSTDAEEETPTSIEEMKDLLEQRIKSEAAPGNKTKGAARGHKIKGAAPGNEIKGAAPCREIEAPDTWPKPKLLHGYSAGKYTALRRRQIKIETEAWEQAAKEYRELLDDMCQHKLAPNLPYVKSLFLGWFEPLRDKILEVQEWCRSPKNRSNYADFFDSLPADMMAVITMHKMMSLMMVGNGDGSVRVVQAAHAIGESIEHEVRTQFLFMLVLTFWLMKTIHAYFCCSNTPTEPTSLVKHKLINVSHKVHVYIVENFCLCVGKFVFACSFV